MTHRIVWLVLAAALLGGCPGKKTGVTDDDTTPSGNNKKGPGKIGAACTAKNPGEKGTCAEGLSCAGFAGGYCTSSCPCGEGGECVETNQMGEICEKPCAADADCRGAAGYVCDQRWKTCTVRGLLVPKAPVCENLAPAMPRKTFGAVDALATATGSTYALQPTAAFNKAGDLVTVFVAGKSGGVGLGAGITSAKGAVEGDLPVAAGEGGHLDPWMDTDRNGKLYLTWLAYEGTPGAEMSSRVMLATSEDGRTWSAPVAATDAAVCPGGQPNCLSRPQVAVGPDRADPKKDAVYVLFHNDEASALQIVRSGDGGATFGAPVTVAKDAFLGDMEVTQSGTIHIIFVGSTAGPDVNKFGDSAIAVQYTNSKDAAATWAAPVSVSGDAKIPVYFASPTILADLKKMVLYAVYPAGSPDGKWNIVLAYSEDGGKTWKTVQVNDDEPCGSHMAPAAVIDPDSGKIYVTWFDNRTGAGSLAYAICPSKGGKCAPAEAVNDKPFAYYGFVRHSSRSLGDYNTAVLDAKKKTLHIFWSQPVDESGQPTTRVFHASTKIK
jgi:hypothetical protein